MKQAVDSFNRLQFYKKKILIAFSGGPDSVFLLNELVKYFQDTAKEHLVVAYVNYHDSPFVDEEERVVRHYISLYHLPFYKVDTHYQKKDHNFEDWARDYRYRFFQSLVKKLNLNGLVTAHQRTDLIETYLLQKQRNNLPSYYGLQEASNLGKLTIYRPLLFISKKEIYQQLKKENLSYYEDLTNQNLKKKRNYFRKDVIPVIDEDEILTEIEKQNQRLKNLYQQFEEITYPVSYLIYDSFSSDDQKRFLFFLLDKKKVSLKGSRRAGAVKDLFSFLKNHTPKEYVINQKYSCYRLASSFFISKGYKNISYSYLFKEKKIYKTPFFTIDLKNYSLFNLKRLPVEIRNYHSGDTLATDLKTKDVYKQLKKQSVPFYLIKIYPVFIQNEKIVAVPFYSDLKSKKLPLVLKSFF